MTTNDKESNASVMRRLIDIVKDYNEKINITESTHELFSVSFDIEENITFNLRPKNEKKTQVKKKAKKV